MYYAVKKLLSRILKVLAIILVFFLSYMQYLLRGTFSSCIKVVTSDVENAIIGIKIHSRWLILYYK